MNNNAPINTKRIIISVVLLLVLSALLLLFARDVIREVFVIPISYLIWVIGVFARTTPQVYFWMVLLLITLMVAYRSLAGKRRPLAPAPPELMELIYQQNPSRGRVAFWQVKTSLMRMRSKYYQASFHNALGRLLIELLAYRYRLTPIQVEDRLNEGSLDVPEEVREYALSSLYRTPGEQQPFFRRTWQSIIEIIRGWLSINASQSFPAVRIEQRVARILDYMNEELEVSHDDSGS